MVLTRFIARGAEEKRPDVTAVLNSRRICTSGRSLPYTIALLQFDEFYYVQPRAVVGSVLRGDARLEGKRQLTKLLEAPFVVGCSCFPENNDPRP